MAYLDIEPESREPIHYICFEPCCDIQGNPDEQVRLARIIGFSYNLPISDIEDIVRLLEKGNETGGWRLLGYSLVENKGFDVYDSDTRFEVYDKTDDSGGKRT